MSKTKLPPSELEICKRLRFARSEILGITQETCAVQIGTDRSTLANYETGRSPVKTSTALRFCRQFIVSEEWLATGRFDAFHQALEERGNGGPWDWERFDRPISTRQCMDLWSDPLSRHVKEGTLFSDAFSNVLAPRYAELVREFTYQQVIQLSDADQWETAVNYLKALHERNVILLNNEAQGRGHREPLYWRTYTRRIFEASSATFGQMISTPPEEWGNLSQEELKTQGNLLLERNGYVTYQSVPPNLPGLLNRLKEATAEHGRKSELAAFLGVPSQSVSMWLSGAREPGGETTLRLLEWVQAEEARQQKSPAGAVTPTEPKTRTRKSNDEKPSPSPRKK